MLFDRWLAALALCAVLVPSHLFAAPLYTVGFLPGADFIPAAMNNAGQIAGSVNTPDGSHAVLYSGGVLHDLGFGFGAGSSSDAVAINGSGAVTGTAVLNGVAHGFLYQNGTLADIGANTSGWGINARGDVVGSTYTDAGSFGFVYSGGTFSQLPNLGTGRMGVAVDINDQGAIAGWSITNYDSSPPPLHPYLFRDGVLHDLGALAGGFETEAAAINNAGQIAGYGKVVNDDHVFLYENGVEKDLGFFGGGALGVVDLNEHGTLIGNASAANGAPIGFVNIGDTVIDLNTLIDPALGWYIPYVYANNDLGQIIGYGCQADTCGVVRLDLAGAVPEPAALLLWLVGALTLPRWEWRRRKKTAVPRGYGGFMNCNADYASRPARLRSFSFR